MDAIQRIVDMVNAKLPPERLSIRGKSVIVLFGPDGKIKDIRMPTNTITYLGDENVADQMSDRTNGLIGYMAVGTGTGGKSVASTGLEAVPAGPPVGRVALDSTTQGTGGGVGESDNDVIYVATFPALTGTGALVEAGLFRLDDNATLWAYQDFSAINKGAADSLQITWTVTFGAS